MLAGGSGKRMGGCNKANLEYDKRTFAERIAHELTETGMPCYLSAAVYEQQIPDRWVLVKDIVSEPDGSYVGPIGGIYSCLRRAAADGLDGLFFVPCDAPFFRSELIRKMMEIPDAGNADAVIWATGDGRLQTTFGWYSVRCLPAFDKDIRDGKYKLKRSLEQIACKVIHTAEAGIDDNCFRNINHTEEYERLMNADMNKPISLEQGVRLILSRTEQITETETVSIGDSCGRTLAENILAPHDQPPFPKSPLDGYAVRSADTAGACKEAPVKLAVVTEVDAGSCYQGTVRPGQAVRIMTGAPIPDGCDAVIGQEDTDYGEETVNIYSSLKPYQNYCRQGEDYCKGDTLLADRTYIKPVETGVLASLGLAQVKVYRKPRVMLMSTGDELVMPGEVLAPGKIYDSNLYTLGAILREWGIDVVALLHASDDPEDVVGKIRRHAGEADLVITTGGVSVGRKDIMHDVFRILDIDRTFWKIGVKPGMAMLSGMYGAQPVLALSGNPYAAFIDMHLAVRPVLMKMTGDTRLEMLRGSAVLTSDYGKKSPVRRFIRAYVQDGMAHIEGHTGGNGDIASGRGINALLDIPAGTEKLKAGDTVQVVFL